MPVRWVLRREGTGREWEVGGSGWDNTAEEEEPARPAPSLRTLRHQRQREPQRKQGLLQGGASSRPGRAGTYHPPSGKYTQGPGAWEFSKPVCKDSLAPASASGTWHFYHFKNITITTQEAQAN